MKTKFFFLAALAGMTLASCSDDVFVGDNSPNVVEETTTEAINFGFNFQNVTRGDIAGPAAAKLLGNNFYVTGTKGTEQATYPTPTLVFDNYLVHYGVNTAGTTESNTANWEYVGIDQGASPKVPEDYSRVKLSTISGTQTIKYWDYSVPQYDFFGFSTGTFAAVSGSSTAATNIGVTAMKYGSNLAGGATAYTFDIPSVDALENTFITDITEVKKEDNAYGKEVTLKFKNLGSKVRIALYETVPGYSVKNVQFYAVEGEAVPTDLGTNTSGDATLISNQGLPTKGTINVLFPHVGDNNASKEDYNKATATVTPGTDPAKSKTFGTLADQLVAKERAEAGDDNVFLGRTLPTATFAGSEAGKFYKTVFPVSTSSPLILRVDYTLVPIDGAAETITVKGAKAVVPSTFTQWLPNYAYTYIFKISDNTNGWTGTSADAPGLFPITFDAVVAEATDATDEQTTITTVSTPTITTYQQNHDPLAPQNEYSKTTKGIDNNVRNVYVQVMDNSTSPATLVTNLNGTTSEGTARSLLYAVTSGKKYSSQPADWPTGYYTDAVCNTEATGTFSDQTTYYKRCTEADVMDALENQSGVVSGNITGRNGILLTKNDNIDATVLSIVNGIDDNPIVLGTTNDDKGKAAKIAIASLDPGTYAYVYDYSNASKTTKTIYQPINATGTLASDVKYVTTDILNGIDTNVAANVTADGEAVNSDSFLYFSKTTNGTGDTTYSFVSVDGKKTLPAGLVKCPVGSLLPSDGSVSADSALFVFTTYTRNTGKYAVKVIKIVA